MNKTVRVRVVNVGSPQPDPTKPIERLKPNERVMVVFGGEVNMQIGFDYEETANGAVVNGDIFEIQIRKIPELGLRIGESSLASA